MELSGVVHDPRVAMSNKPRGLSTDRRRTEEPRRWGRAGFVAIALLGSWLLSACEGPVPPPTPLQRVEPVTPIATLSPVTPTAPPPTETPLPLATNPPEPTTTATPVPAARLERQTDGTYIVTTEKGQVLTVPAITGLHQEIQEIHGVKTVVYRAENSNPYGIKENVFAGLFYPEFYNRSPEKTEQTGAVSLRVEVTNQLLLKAGFPDNVIFPLPYDITPGENSNQITELQFIKTSEGPNYIALRLPNGSTVVNGLPRDVFIHYAPQPQNGTLLIVFEPNKGVFRNGAIMSTSIPQQNNTATDQVVASGKNLPTATIDGFFTSKYLDRIQPNFQTRLMRPINAILVVRTNTAPIVTIDLSLENILTLGGAKSVPVLNLSSTNPLLSL
ncbi:MAG: hypothetical protein FJ015_07230 [Chloroflexi bacterium]|nr:hypothetical protein [Chloroflexota bacterium]